MTIKPMLALGAFAVLVFVSCPLRSSENDEVTRNQSGTPEISEVPNPGNQTRIILDNSGNPFHVSVYWHGHRQPGHLIGTVEGGQRLTVPAGQFIGEQIFYPVYYVQVENHLFSLDHRVVGMRHDFEWYIERDETTTVPIPPISGIVPEVFPDGRTLVDDIFVYIRNGGSSNALRLFRGASLVTDDDNNIIVVNPGATGVFGNLAAGSTLDLSVRVGPLGALRAYPFPSDELPTLKPGHFYFLEFDGTAVRLVREVPITLPLIGNLGITGTPRVGAVLTADTSSFVGTGNFSFQWRRGNTVIDGATGSSYNVRVADVGWPISVTVTRTGYTGSVTRSTGIVPVPGDNLQEQFGWLLGGATGNLHYVVEVDRDQGISPMVLSRPSDGNDITIIIRGVGGSQRMITPNRNGALLTVGSGVTLVLDSDITLQGMSTNNSYLVRVDNGGTLIMDRGARVTGNIGGGGVNLSGGVFDMHGGTISGNRGGAGGFGGVNVGYGARFYMHGGTISGNHGGVGSTGNTGSAGNNAYGSGNNGGAGGIGGIGAVGGTGGVNVNNGGTFAMHGGEILDNRGGTGGTGGTGGIGGNGDSRSSIGRSGGDGGRGGDGGNAGRGGHGGVNVNNGGRFTLYFGTISNNQGGAGGVGGRGGDGGNRGTGGLGGANGRGGRGGNGGNGAGGGVGGNNINTGGVFVRDGGIITNNSGGSGGGAGGGGSSGRYNGGNGTPGGYGTAGPGNGALSNIDTRGGSGSGSLGLV